MKTAQVSPAEMADYIGRFSASKPSPTDASGRKLSSGALRPVLAADGAPVKSWPGLSMTIAECPPGSASNEVLHPHAMHTLFCLSGELEIAVGGTVPQRVVLRLCDTLTLPPEAPYSFRNTSGADARLLLIDQLDDYGTHTVGALPVGHAEFRQLVAYQDSFKDVNAVLSKVTMQISARKVFPVMIPGNLKGRNEAAPLRGWPGVSLSLCECPPGNGASPHMHVSTREQFVCVRGTFDVIWGDDAEHRLGLEPLDFVAMPPGIMRGFCNTSDEMGYLLVVIQGDEQMTDTTAIFPELLQELEEKFGPGVEEALARIKIRVDAERSSAPRPVT